MTIQAQQALENSQSRYAQLSVGDKVSATINCGSSFVTCRIYAIEETVTKCLWNGVVFSVENKLFLSTTLLLEAFDRQAVIAEIMALVA